MGKTAVIYATKTKHSKKLAEAVATALNVKADNIIDRPDIKDIELLVIVGGIYGGESLPELLEYVKNINCVSLKRAALVTSCASGSQKQTKLRGILEAKGIKVTDELVCKGGFLFVGIGHPNEKDLKVAAEFARGLV